MVCMKPIKIVGVISLVAAVLIYSIISHNAKEKNSQLLRVAWEKLPDRVDPRFASDANSQYLEDLVHCSLISFDKDGKTNLELADSLEWKSPSELEVQLKSGVLFRSGKKLSSKDVVGTYRFFLKNKKMSAPRDGAFRNVKSVKALSDSKLVFELKEPDASFVTNLVVGILPDNFSPLKDFLSFEELDSCGAFVISSVREKAILLEQNPSYSLGQVPSIRHIELVEIKAESTRLAKLKAGEIHLVQNSLNREEFVKLRGQKEFAQSLAFLSRPGLNTAYLGFQFQNKVLQNKKLRQALYHAIDRESLIKYILSGMARKAQSLLLPFDNFFADGLRTYEYDLDKARKLLDEAGLPYNESNPNKARLSLSYKTSTDATRVAIAKAIAAQLKRVHINLEIESLEWGRLSEDLKQGNMEIWSLSWIGFKDPDIYRYAFSTDNIPPEGPNRGRYKNDLLDDLLKRAQKETRLKQRHNLYKSVQGLLQDDLPYLWLWHEDIFAVHNLRLKDFELYADGRLSSLKVASFR